MGVNLAFSTHAALPSQRVDANVELGAMGRCGPEQNGDGGLATIPDSSFSAQVRGA